MRSVGRIRGERGVWPRSGTARRRRGGAGVTREARAPSSVSKSCPYPSSRTHPTRRRRRRRRRRSIRAAPTIRSLPHTPAAGPRAHTRPCAVSAAAPKPPSAKETASIAFRLRRHTRNCPPPTHPPRPTLPGTGRPGHPPPPTRAWIRARPGRASASTARRLRREPENRLPPRPPRGVAAAIRLRRKKIPETARLPPTHTLEPAGPPRPSPPADPRPLPRTIPARPAGFGRAGPAARPLRVGVRLGEGARPVGSPERPRGAPQL